jgi:hypothetical protein
MKKLAMRWLSIVVTVKPDGSVIMDGSLPPSKIGLFSLSGSMSDGTGRHLQP